MDKGVKSLDISKTEPSNKATLSLEQRVYSKKYTELNGFLQIIDQKVKTSQSLERKIRKYFRVGSIAKRGFEKASKTYDENLKPFHESYYLLEEGQTPTLLHKYAANTKKRKKLFNTTIVRDMIKDFESDITKIAYKYKIQLEKFCYNRAVYYILSGYGMEEIEKKPDVIEALMLARRMGVTDVVIPYWDRKKVDDKKVYEFIDKLLGQKIIHSQILKKISNGFGITMSESTLYRYIGELEEPIRLPIETDILPAQSNVG